MVLVQEYIDKIEQGRDTSAYAAAALARRAFINYLNTRGTPDNLECPDHLAEFIQVAASLSRMESSIVQMEFAIMGSD